MEFSGKAAVIVGGASGMAKAMAEMLVREAARVSILDFPCPFSFRVRPHLVALPFIQS
jgi:NAD(P)-dependent dehydrogenase (short-subunit alcohol dehydrogenase family)